MGSNTFEFPTSIGALPASIGALPASIGALPTPIGALPAPIGALSASIDALPASIGAVPASIGGRPTKHRRDEFDLRGPAATSDDGSNSGETIVNPNESGSEPEGRPLAPPMARSQRSHDAATEWTRLEQRA